MNWGDLTKKGPFLYIPLCNPLNGDCDCKWHNPCRTPGKVPLQRGWNQKGSPFRPDGNAGIIVGKVAGYFVFDVDGEEEAAVYKGFGLPETRTHKTGHGYHYFFKWPVRVNPETGEILFVEGLPGRYHGLLVRGSRAPEQVVAPESVHESGFIYSVALDIPMAQLPASFLEELVRESKESNNFGPLDKLEKGERHLGFFSMACTFRYRDLPLDTAIAAALHFNEHHCEPPAPEASVTKIIEDAYGRYPVNQPFLSEYRNGDVESGSRSPSTRGWRV